LKLSVKDSGHRSKYSDYYKEKNKMGKRRVGRPRKVKRKRKACPRKGRTSRRKKRRGLPRDSKGRFRKRR